jgi:hypothetical protein
MNSNWVGNSQRSSVLLKVVSRSEMKDGNGGQFLFGGFIWCAPFSNNQSLDNMLHPNSVIGHVRTFIAAPLLKMKAVNTILGLAHVSTTPNGYIFNGEKQQVPPAKLGQDLSRN